MYRMQRSPPRSMTGSHRISMAVRAAIISRASICPTYSKHDSTGSRVRSPTALAPTHLAVPSGSQLKLDYNPDESPVLAVKLQEMFGLADTPRIARGRVPVTLHLLSPARPPIQATQDLRGFWVRTE